MGTRRAAHLEALPRLAQAGLQAVGASDHGKAILQLAGGGMGNGHIAGEHDKRLGFPAGQGLYQLPVLGERHAQDDHRKWLQGEEVERLLDRRGIETSVSSAWMVYLIRLQAVRSLSMTSLLTFIVGTSSFRPRIRRGSDH